MTELPQRKKLPHQVPNWVPDGEIYFITINCKQRGINQLTTPYVFEAIKASAANYSERNLWHIRLMLIMPDHIHCLMTLNTREKSISTIIGGWKRYLNKTNPITWQSSYFEHRIRNQDELMEKEEYIRLNPVRAGLCKNHGDWAYIIRDPR